MSCAYVLLLVLVLTTSVVSTLAAPRLPRDLPGPGAHRVFQWGQTLRLFMHDNGTVQLRPSRSNLCSGCNVEQEFLCDKHNVTGCPEKRLEPGDKDSVMSTIVMLKFISAGRYLCMSRNATIYTVVNPGENQSEECAFYVVNQNKPGRVFIYHFKYPEKKHSCRLSELRKVLKQRKRNLRPRKKRRRVEKNRRVLNNLCVKYYLRKGNDNSLTTFKGKFFNESRWDHSTRS